MLEQRESLFLHSVVNVGKVNSAKCSYPCKIDGCMRRALLSRICDVHSVELTHPSIFLSFPLHCCQLVVIQEAESNVTFLGVSD